jgi:MFS family permease
MDRSRLRIASLVPGDVLRRRSLWVAALITVVFGATTNTPIFFFALFTQQVWQLSALRTGALFVPCNLGIVAGAALGGRLTGTLGARRAAALGMSSVLAALVLLARISAAADYSLDLLPGLVLLGVGVGMSQVATTAAGTADAAVGEHGFAAGVLSASAPVGTALGLTLLASVAASRTAAFSQSSSSPSADALSAGFALAFTVAAGLAGVGIALTAGLRRSACRSGRQGETGGHNVGEAVFFEQAEERVAAQAGLADGGAAQAAQETGLLAYVAERRRVGAAQGGKTSPVKLICD